MNTPVHMSRYLARHHRLLAVFLILYLLGGCYVSFGTFHHVRLGSIAGINYQAVFEASTFIFKVLGFSFLCLPVLCLCMAFSVERKIPSLKMYIKRYLLCIIPALVTLALIFYWRQDPGMVVGEGHSGTVTSLVFWLYALLFWAMTRTRAYRQ
ncbi:TPA: hypothetical protein ACNUIJ_003992 [Salmonella enterica subsp. enterica serovar Derby]